MVELCEGPPVKAVVVGIAGMPGNYTLGLCEDHEDLLDPAPFHISVGRTTNLVTANDVAMAVAHVAGETAHSGAAAIEAYRDALTPKGRCSRCNELDLRSTVRVGEQRSIGLGGTDQFYDEAGQHHSHYSSRYRLTFTCSQGHQWTETTQASCPYCDWTQGEQSIEYTDDGPMAPVLA